MVTCRQLIEEFLADYLDGTLAPDQLVEIEAHFAACPPCVVYLNTYRKTRELVQKQAADMPPEMRAILERLVLDRLSRPKP
jgi:anti-sigma factor RsiW